MQSTGIRRKVDDLGRIVIPAGIRRSLEIREGDSLEFSVDGDRVIVAKPSEHCVFCDEATSLRVHRQKRICESCVAALTGSTSAPEHEAHNESWPSRIAVIEDGPPPVPPAQDDESTDTSSPAPFEERYQPDHQTADRGS